MLQRVVIVGAGQAGMQAAASLRDEGFEGAITLIGAEPGLPYQRPPLSKAYLTGKTDEDGLILREQSYFAEQRIDLVHGDVAAIERAEKRVRLASGQAFEYDHLILALGARNRVLALPGVDLEGVAFLRTLAEAKALKALMAGAGRAVVVGAGFIGLEFAAVARAKGLDVHVVEIAPRAMGRSLSTEMARFFAEQHVAMGTKFLFGAGVSRVLGEAGRAAGVELSDGMTAAADLILMGVGVVPNTELAAAAGLAVGNGIVVDELLLTSDETISAIGDCSLHPNPYAEGSVRLESVQNAMDQARCVAARLTGRIRRYEAVPWFWSDQGDLKLQMAGLTAGHDTAVLRGDPAKRAFSVFCYKDGKMLGVESVNKPGDHLMARKLLALGKAPTPVQAADEGFNLKSLLG